ncbi:NUDIX domain-containing protein [Nocardioides limicola]|uniref:NUDIX domain-containing protein n=1 Tax=Nocardioides limicola TaxID=2803368 RepID=UPI00193B0574|nr:NUDIX domain-containing protein [Nocardioides sp. DJM-14]
MQRFASVIAVDRRGWLLLQERDEHARIDPETWGFPGGHVDAGESDLAAAYRELAEETGVRLTDGLAWWREDRVTYREGEPAGRVALFVCGLDLSDADIECHEGRQMVFVSPERALELPLTRSAALALADFLGSDQYRRLTEAR